MENKRALSRLGSKLIGISLLGLALAFAVFYFVSSVVGPWLLYSERFSSFWQSRNDAAVAAYQAHVTKEQLSVRQAMDDMDGKLASGIYTIMVGTPRSADAVLTADGTASVDYAEYGDIGYSFTWAGLTETDIPHASSVEFVMELHQIQCADGVLYISVAPAAARYAGLVRLAGLLLALLGFCAVMIPCIVRLVRRIGVLSRETSILMAGNLEHSIHMEGRDELSALGEDIERLRQSVAARLAGEREAVSANSRLITSLSHDLRTPLTKLTGYLDILIYQKYRNQEEHDAFLRLASEKAAQLKALTNQLFDRAQVDAPEAGLEHPPEIVDGAALLGQLLVEQGDDLRREGFGVQLPALERSFPLYLRTEDAVRIFDNLFSNFKKYADPAFPIRIEAEDGPDTVTLRLENRAKAAPDRSDSRGVGVPTMKELMARSGGTLEASLSEGAYVSTVVFRKHRES